MLETLGKQILVMLEEKGELIRDCLESDCEFSVGRGTSYLCV